ncbi:group III truncated hemoglobin [Sphingobacterium lactis]|uniref:group III truncated hemoglobin n=1 Tax=Sphingobacterium lactis TaxID=797291 RepID=UPI003EC6BEBA
MEREDIKNLADIQILVDTFYDTIRKDQLLGPIFDGIIQDRWPEHLEKMYRFWQTVLLEEHTYYGSPFPPHAKMPIQKEHFDRWIHLFNQTVDALYTGETADRAKWQGNRMAEMFQFKIQHLNGMNNLV